MPGVNENGSHYHVQAGTEEYVMISKVRTASAAVALAAGLVTTALTERSLGMDLFEIQVYQADVNEPGHFGLEIHSNYTIDGRSQAAYAGEQPPNHVARLTL